MDTRTITHADHTDTETLFGEVWAVTACNCELVTKSIEQTGADDMEHKCTLCNHYSRTDEQNERHESSESHIAAARITELEAQNKRLVEALGWTLDNMTITGYQPDEFAEYEFCNICGMPEWEHDPKCEGVKRTKSARALLAELSQ